NVLTVMPKRDALALIANWRRSTDNGHMTLIDGKPTHRLLDHVPLVRFRQNVGGLECYWLLTELDPDSLAIGFGLHVMPGYKPILGYIHLWLICDPDSAAGPATRDKTFRPKLTLMEHYS